MTRAEVLKGLLASVEKADGSSRPLSAAIHNTVLNQNGPFWVTLHCTAGIDAAISLVREALPGWSWRVMSCFVSDDAWVEPDFNCPTHGARLVEEFDPGTDWVALTDVARAPAGQPALAIMEAMLKALIVIEERKALDGS